MSEHNANIGSTYAREKTIKSGVGPHIERGYFCAMDAAFEAGTIFAMDGDNAVGWDPAGALKIKGVILNNVEAGDGAVHSLVLGGVNGAHLKLASGDPVLSEHVTALEERHIYAVG